MDENKDYVLNIRVSRETYNKLRSKARENRESLSSLVRKAVHDGLEIFGDIKKDFFGEKNDIFKKNVPDFDYFQSVIAAKNLACQRCSTQIAKGERAFIGETKSGSRKYFCSTCFAGI